MHLARLTAAAKAVALTLAERQAEAVHLHEHTDRLQPVTPVERLDELWSDEQEAQLRSGRENLNPRGLRRLLQAALGKNRRNIFTSYVSRPPPQS